jgi:hypothetical protein
VLSWSVAPDLPLAHQRRSKLSNMKVIRCRKNVVMHPGLGQECMHCRRRSLALDNVPRIYPSYILPISAIFKSDNTVRRPCI